MTKSTRKHIRVRDHCHITGNENIEDLLIKIVIVVTWYRPPDSPIGIFSPFETLFGKLETEKNTEYYLMGDLNCDMIATRYDNAN